MIYDSLNQFANNQQLSFVGTGRQVVGSAIDLGSPVRDPGMGKPVFLVITIPVAITSGGAATVTFELVSDSTSPPAADGSETAHWISDAIPVADLVQGYRMVVPLPSVKPVYERYLALQANVGSFALTAGKVTAFLTLDEHGWMAYPEGAN